MTLPAAGQVIGWCGLQFGQSDHLEAEISYALHRRYWGQGYMTEAAQALVAYGFTDLKIHRVFGKCGPENIASIHVLQNLGMSQEGHLRRKSLV